jgi:hypothetical protein
MANRVIKLGRVVGSMIYSGPAVNNEAIQSDLKEQSIKPKKFDLYISTSGNFYQYQADLQNELKWILLMNITGPAGKIAKTYASVSEMNAAFSTDGVVIGGLVLIDTGNVEDVDNAKLFVKGNDKYNYLTDLSGAQGIKGEPGIGIESIAKTKTDGLVDTYTISLSNNSTTSFEITNGAVGATGENGKTPSFTINSNGELIATFD